MNEAAIEFPGLAGKIVKYRLLSEPIRLQNLEDYAHSHAWKKNIYVIHWLDREVRIGRNCARVLSTARGHRLRVVPRPRTQFLPIRTDLGR